MMGAIADDCARHGNGAPGMVAIARYGQALRDAISSFNERLARVADALLNFTTLNGK